MIGHLLHIYKMYKSDNRSDVVKKIIKENYIFNNIVLVSRLRVIKVLPKSNMSII